MQIRRLHRHWFSEFANICASGQYTIGAGDHNCLDASVVGCPLQCRSDCLPGREAHAVDGRIIDRDDGNIFMGLIACGHWGFLGRI